MQRRVLVLSLLFLLLMPLSSWADIVVHISATPNYPAPNQNVVLTAHSAAQKGEYSYAWAVNGTLLNQGVDADTAIVNSGAPGTETDVSVVLIDTAGNVAGSDSYVVRSGSVDLVWEGKTYTPPFYRGKPYPNGDSQIQLQAIPHITLPDGTEEPDDNLVYTWQVDGKTLTSVSGYGKSALSVKPTALRRATTVTVTAQTRDGLFNARSSVTIPTTNPRIVFYQDRPLGGVQFNTAVTPSYAFVGNEMTFWAVPFFVVNPKAMGVGWTVNGKAFASESVSPYIATLRKTGVGAGTYTIGVSIQRSGNIFEQAANAFNLSFE